MEAYFFNGWGNLLRVIVVGILAYAALVFFLRISGNRTLSKMNAFDLIVTVALGSTLATVLLSKNVALSEGAVAMALLISLQFIITWFSVRTAWVRRLVTGEPLMLLYRGEFITTSMRKARVTQDEVQSAIRGSGIADVKAVEAVVLETDGSISVIKQNAESSHSSLEGIRGPR
ncbi:DUF421 domain-containing protein [Vreelandella sulfidaeris]|uniref:DUF421 domain-containing protein n=1 Tax=Vreelandella sulfidaeris TaxID=115553 RepID=A0A365TKT9_9GAMM|nr:YetF domain-containing protein [Halomonas sulfidaeris]RBI66439.1 DUF421 domain-containing protein [Halomonas sulfidaeris]